MLREGRSTRPVRTGQITSFQQACLPQHRSMVPVDPLRRHLAIPKLDENYERYIDLLARRRDTWQEPIHPLGMMKLDASFLGDAFFGGDAIEQRVPPVGRDRWNEFVAVERPQAGLARATPTGRQGIHRGALDHRGQRLVMVLGEEFPSAVLLPSMDIVLC